MTSSIVQCLPVFSLLATTIMVSAQRGGKGETKNREREREMIMSKVVPQATKNALLRHDFWLHKFLQQGGTTILGWPGCLRAARDGAALTLLSHHRIDEILIVSHLVASSDLTFSQSSASQHFPNNNNDEGLN